MKHSQGSALLMVVVILSALLLAANLLWRSTAFNSDIAFETCKTMRIQSLVEALIPHYSTFIKNDWDFFVLHSNNYKREFSLSIKPFCAGLESIYEGFLSVIYKSDTVLEGTLTLYDYTSRAQKSFILIKPA